ncbi:MAG: GDYXXLXY domain-containing protein, partial [Candidatus Sericytochromatia bacterium]|nr:GDYXXLXY domain-containing protein [Candidatus Sericytochromatia bacterium]
VLAPGVGTGPWRPVVVSLARPADRPGHVLLRGDRTGGSLAWGLEQYLIPEAQGDVIEQAMAAAREASRPIQVEAKVGPDGTAKLEALWIDGRAY